MVFGNRANQFYFKVKADYGQIKKQSMKLQILSTNPENINQEKSMSN
jgi:hypothetical protein